MALACAQASGWLTGAPGGDDRPPAMDSPTPAEPSLRQCSSEGAPDVARVPQEVPDKRPIKQFYDLEAELGKGRWGAVYKARDKLSGDLKAIKKISKSNVMYAEDLQREVSIMKRLDHPNITKLYETFEDVSTVYMVMELCLGGELFEHIIDEDHFTEVQAAIVMKQAVRAISYMHENYVCHRDLKPENMLLLRQVAIEQNVLKVIDFGISRRFEKGCPISASRDVASAYYVAPEVLAGRYDQLCDMWSLGVIMYIMLCGYPPFSGDTDPEVLEAVRLGQFHFDYEEWDDVSEDARDLIRKLLEKSVARRCTAQQALQHEWVQKQAPNARVAPLHSKKFVAHLREFSKQPRFRKAALHVIARSLDEGHVRTLREIFEALDGNGRGQLTAAEIEEGLQQAGMTGMSDDVQQIVAGLGRDGNGSIRYTDFLAASLDKRLFLSEETCRSAFALFDRDGDGRISHEDLKKVLKEAQLEDLCGEEAAVELLKEVDTKGQGALDFEDFMKMMRIGARRRGASQLVRVSWNSEAAATNQVGKGSEKSKFEVVNTQDGRVAVRFSVQVAPHNRQRNEWIHNEIRILQLLADKAYTADPGFPRIVELIEANITPQRSSITVELVEPFGFDVFCLIAKYERAEATIGVPVVAHIVSQLCQALAYLQVRSVVHGDLRDENILVTREANVKLIRFGIAAFAGEKRVWPDTPNVPLEARGKCVEAHHAQDLYGTGHLLASFQHGFDEWPAELSEAQQHLSEENPEKRMTLEELRAKPWVVRAEAPASLPEAERKLPLMRGVAVRVNAGMLTRGSRVGNLALRTEESTQVLYIDRRGRWPPVAEPVVRVPGVRTEVREGDWLYLGMGGHKKTSWRADMHTMAWGKEGATEQCLPVWLTFDEVEVPPHAIGFALGPPPSKPVVPRSFLEPHARGYLHLRNTFGINLVGIKRHGKYSFFPGPDFVFEEGDVGLLVRILEQDGSSTPTHPQEVLECFLNEKLFREKMQGL